MTSRKSGGPTDLAVPETVPTYEKPAAGFPGVWHVVRYAQSTSGLMRGTKAMLHLNQVKGFDCPSCAWPEPNHRSITEFCENGARATAHEADTRRADASFFDNHTLAELEAKSDYWLEQQGRLVTPLVKPPGKDHYEPTTYEKAYALVGKELKKLRSNPDQLVCYTSGRASNEAAFLYQLFTRSFGTNNLPDCSNMCHESSGVGLGTTIGVGKGTVQLDDFAEADLILILGQNPGTNHPRMLSTLAEARERGAAIVAINPLKEVGLISFGHPQTVRGMLGFGERIASHYAQVKIGGDVALLKGMMKEVVAKGALDHEFLEKYTEGLDALLADLAATSWDDITSESGIDRGAITALAELYVSCNKVIACWAMGITQHKNGVDNVRAIVDLLLLRGNLGKPGAGVCPVRGHSNVQGDRTMGIFEKMPEGFLKRLDAAAGITSPRKHGYDAVAAAQAFERGDAKAFIGLGGNYARAMSDSDRVHAALQKTKLTVHIGTKLNRTHLAAGEVSIVFPCLARSERDVRKAGPQLVTVEDSMSKVHASSGALDPADAGLQSEVAIICGIAAATIGDSEAVNWGWLSDDYDRIRDLIARVVEGCDDFNARVRGTGFLLRNAAREREFDTPSGKAILRVVPLVRRAMGPQDLVLMTIRSHDQFNTTLYGEDDRYRGVYGRRNVVFMNEEDMKARGLAAEDEVVIRGRHENTERVLGGFHAIPYDIPRGNVAGYYPETNPLVPLESFADESRTPTSKSIIVTIERASPG
jgi:molybdopterin-dependent oxidoreductase alpha subunit